MTFWFPNVRMSLFFRAARGKGDFDETILRQTFRRRRPTLDRILQSLLGRTLTGWTHFLASTHLGLPSVSKLSRFRSLSELHRAVVGTKNRSKLLFSWQALNVGRRIWVNMSPSPTLSI